MLPAGPELLAGGRRRSAASLGSRGPGSGRCSSPEDSVALGRFRLFCPWGAQVSLGSLPQSLAYTLVSRSFGVLQLPFPAGPASLPKPHWNISATP